MYPQQILRLALAYNLSTADKRRIARVTEHNSPSPMPFYLGEKAAQPDEAGITVSHFPFGRGPG